MTLFTSSSWSLFCGRGCGGLHGAASADPSTGSIYKRFMLCTLHEFKVKKKIIQRGTAYTCWVFLSLKSSKLLPSSKSAYSMQKVDLCRQEVLKARASFTLTRWWKGSVCQMFLVGKEFRRKKGPHSLTLSSEANCWRTESYWLETILV